MCRFQQKVYIEQMSIISFLKRFQIVLLDWSLNERMTHTESSSGKFVTDGSGRHSAGVGIRKKTGCQWSKTVYLVMVPGPKRWHLP